MNFKDGIPLCPKCGAEMRQEGASVIFVCKKCGMVFDVIKRVHEEKSVMPENEVNGAKADSVQERWRRRERPCPECRSPLEAANKPVGMHYAEENHYRCTACGVFVVVNTTGKDETAAGKFLTEAKMKAKLLQEILIDVLQRGEGD